MSVWVMPPIAGLIEPAVAPEFYIDGVGAIEQVGPNVRLYCYVRQLALDMNGETSKPVVVKLMRPKESVGAALVRMFKIIGVGEDGEPSARPPQGRRPHLVT